MNKKFTDNELRAYSKNRFEERALRRRLERLREEFLNYNDTSAKHKSNIIQENRSLRRTSGGSPVRSLFSDEDWKDNDFCVRDRVRRPWAYSVMETTYNSIYREAELPLPKSRGRQRAKSAATVLMSTPCITDTEKCDKKKDRDHLPSLLRNTMSASRIDNMPSSESLKSHTTTLDGCLLPPSSNQSTKVNFKNNGDHVNVIEVIEPYVEEDVISSQDDVHVSTDISNINVVEEDTSRSVREKPSVMFKNDESETRPYTKVISLPPAYRIDSKSYQDAEWERLRARSKSLDTFTQSVGVVIVPSPDDKTQARSVDKQDKVQNTKQETASTSGHMDVITTETDKPQQNDKVCNESVDKKEKCIVKSHDIVTYRGLLIKNYIRPEDRYKLDPSILNRRQHRMDKLAKESSTYLKRINHENIRVEIAFPKSARKRLLTKLVEENNSGRKTKLPNKDSPFIKKKIECFMTSISDYIEQQGIDRAHTTI